MDTNKLKKFAQYARRSLVEQLTSKLDVVLGKNSSARRENEKAVRKLEQQISETSREHVIEQVAYTWFNRFCALRFMDANRYTRTGVVSPAEGFLQPELLMEAKQGQIDGDLNVNRKLVMELLDGTRPSTDPQQEAYRLLLVAVCNYYHGVMPFMFEEISDYTELLIPDDLLSENSVLTYIRQALYPESCTDVEVIGWLYQFYISEKKDEVFDALKKGKKITPENIPAATQLFTPHWIVRYLVENSLGRLWMLNFPNSKLVDRMEYYIRPEQTETDFLRISNPEEIKICDPACGSGHMLTYAFDLLYAIYEEQGYQATEIPRLILSHNLFGVEIDQRAGALAAFALTMKAREKDRRFFTRGRSTSDDSLATRSSAPGTQPNICVLENIHIDPDDLSAYMDKVGRNLFSNGLQGVVNQWEEADNFGSLIRPLVTDVSDVLELLRERQMGSDLFLAGVHQKVLKTLRQAEYLSPKYHVVVANPPYMGGKGMDSRLSDWARECYPESKSDLFAMFMERNLSLAVVGGTTAMITMQTWMFLDSFHKLRHKLLTEYTCEQMVHLGPRAFDTIGGEIVSTTAFVLKNVVVPDTRGLFVRLVAEDSEAAKSGALLSTVKSLRNSDMLDSPSNIFRVAANEFIHIPGLTFAYWASSQVRHLFATGKPLKELADFKQGLATCNNDLFLRFWFEVSDLNSAVGRPFSDQVRETRKWFTFIKGGENRRWYGNLEIVVNWRAGGRDIHEYNDKPMDYNAAPLRAKQYYFREGLNWSSIASSFFAVRYSPEGTIFGTGGSSGFSRGTDLYSLISFLNSKVSGYLMNSLSMTLNVEVGQVSSLPFIADIGCIESTKTAIEIHKADWNSLESSWGFQATAMLENVTENQIGASYAGLRTRWRQVADEMKTIQEQLNQAYISGYGLSDELTAHVPSEEITLYCNPAYRYGSDKSDSELEALLLADTMREFISYAVGCMLGRFSLDKLGLILVNQGETVDDYRQQIPEPSFAPDEDNVIPLLDGDWFEDDITERFKEFLKVTFGTEHYEENLTFLENALYPDNLTGKKRKTIRDYFLKEFYNHHIKLYKKRPIYWLFSSPKGTFNALIYMHRYRPDTVSVVLGYLRDFNAKLKAKVESLQRTADSANASATEKTKALKEIVTLRKDIRELDDYERDILYPLATERLEIDLDDGVKVNYPKFGKALKKIVGMEASDE